MEVNDFYAEYDRLMPRICPQYERNLDLVNGLVRDEAHRILELGSGTGNLAQRIVRMHAGVQVVGLEMREELVRLAQAKEYGGSVEFMVGDVRDAPFDKYQGIVSALTLHHLKKDEKYVVYQKIIRNAEYFVNYDRVLLSERREREVREYYAEFMRANGLSEELIAHANAEMDVYDHPLSIRDELMPFRENNWRIIIARCKNGFVVYKAEQR